MDVQWTLQSCFNVTCCLLVSVIFPQVLSACQSSSCLDYLFKAFHHLAAAIRFYIYALILIL